MTLRPVRVKWYKDVRWLRVLSLALLLGIVIAGFLGVLVAVVVRFPVETPCKQDVLKPYFCQASFSRLLLPFPDPNVCKVA